MRYVCANALELRYYSLDIVYSNVVNSARSWLDFNHTTPNCITAVRALRSEGQENLVLEFVYPYVFFIAFRILKSSFNPRLLNAI